MQLTEKSALARRERVLIKRKDLSSADFETTAEWNFSNFSLAAFAVLTYIEGGLRFQKQFVFYFNCPLKFLFETSQCVLITYFDGRVNDFGQLTNFLEIVKSIIQLILAMYYRKVRLGLIQLFCTFFEIEFFRFEIEQ